jgi:hypothetical protein
VYYDFADLALSNWTHTDGRKTVIHTAMRETQIVFLISNERCPEHIRWVDTLGPYEKIPASATEVHQWLLCDLLNPRLLQCGIMGLQGDPH